MTRDFEKRVRLAKEASKMRQRARARMHRRHPKCWYCGRSISLESATVDHIIPLSKGGKDHRRNYALACSACNNRKGNRLLSEAGMRLTAAPHDFVASRAVAERKARSA